MINSEQNIIGSILMDNDSLYHIYEKIKPEMFQSELLQDCYKEALALYDRGEQITPIALATNLENRERGKEFIGNVLTDCVMSVETSTFIKSYADSLIKEYRSREIKFLVDHLDFSPANVNNSMADLMTRLEELEINESQKAKHISKIVEENKNEHFIDKEESKSGIKTGFYKLDDCLGDLERGDVTVIGARPAVGKSALSTQIIYNMANRGLKVGYYNLEMNEKQVYQRMMARLAQLSLTRIRRAKNFLGQEEYMWNKANEELAKKDIYVSTGSKTVGQIRNESKHQHYDVIIIDYLQLVKSERHFNNRASEVGDISKRIKEIASELDTHIILLSQLNRTSEGKETKEPTMAELRESGDIEQDASTIILLWNLSEKERRFKGLKVDKNRMGELLKEGLEFCGENMEFRERNEDFYQFVKRAKEFDKNAESLNSSNEIDPFSDGGLLFK